MSLSFIGACMLKELNEGDLVLVESDVPAGIAQLSFIGIVVSISPYFVHVVNLKDAKSYRITPDWCEVI